VEHAILHLIYSRFFTKVMRDLGLIQNAEPAARLFTQGMVIKDGAKMSKNKGNVVSAEDMIARFGADTGRLFELFAAPPEKDMDWTDTGAEGAYRFLGRVCRFVTRNADREVSAGDPASDRKALRKLHQTIAKITDDFEDRWHFNTSIAGLMELVNVLYAEEDKLSRTALEQILPALVLLLGPFAPYLAEELWEALGRTGPVFRQPWPEADQTLAKEDAAEVVLQVNGKVRGRIMAPFGTSKEELEKLALADPSTQPFVTGKQVVKVVVVPDKLVNIVVK
jgi:leucyl-tRNA synthetase